MVSKRKRSRLEAIAKGNDIKGFFEEFRKETDRATAILGAAYLDEQLVQLITYFLIDDEDEVRNLLDNEKPLGSFGARIRAAYCMGLLTKENFQDLNLIKTIRNEFAHRLHGLAFGDESIANRCANLQVVKRVQPNKLLSPRDLFISAVGFISIDLNFRWIEAQEKRCQIPSVTLESQRPPN